ncbi:ParB N-terminal domain-containing protein [Methylorubrum rhodesianum]|uniref:ParB/RepB/Spo0J family partition protein n=1 Tax=Methylorubrum rhodesianum TaxID=29427 RepID=UPI003D2AB9A5
MPCSLRVSDLNPRTALAQPKKLSCTFPLTPLNRLRHGHDEGAPEGVCNVRISGREDGLDELAASIASVGLLQPLVVVRSGGLSYVADGNRRLAALLRLAAAGTIPEDQEIEVVERDPATAREAGLAANLNQVAMHEADQTAAFAALARDGLKVKDIAAKFGVAVAYVKRLLALGSVAPSILDAWRGGKLAIGQVQAFTLAPSTAEQERVFDKLSKANRLWGNAIREELGADHSTDRLLKAVGLKAFKAAGGHVVEDLFGEGKVVSDRALLKRLADEKLIARRDELRAEGWGWVELESDLPPQARCSWASIRDVRLEPFETQAARIREIEAVLEAEDDGTVSDEVVDALSAEHRAIEADLLVKPGRGDRPRSGCIVSLDFDGGIYVREYVLRPEEAKATAPIAVPEAASDEPEAKGLSSALVDRLSVQMTQAVQGALDVSPHAAIAGLLAGATCVHPWHSPVRLRLEGFGATERSPRANETFEALFARYMAMLMPELLRYVGRVLALGVDLRTRRRGRGRRRGARRTAPRSRLWRARSSPSCSRRTCASASTPGTSSPRRPRR